MKPDDVSQEAWDAACDAGHWIDYDTQLEAVARAITAAVAAEREACAESGRAAVMKFRSAVGGRYYPGHHEDMRDAVAAAIRARSQP